MNLRVFMISIFSFLIIINSCKRNENNETEGRLITHSVCKSNKSFVPDSAQSCIEYTYTGDTKTLYIKHINTAFNCCPDKLYCDISFSGDTIILDEFERKQECSCMCLFDMEMEVYNVENTTYVIKVIEPYVGDQVPLIFEIDLENQAAGEYCVERTNYPWGI